MPANYLPEALGVGHRSQYWLSKLPVSLVEWVEKVAGMLREVSPQRVGPHMESTQKTNNITCPQNQTIKFTYNKQSTTELRRWVCLSSVDLPPFYELLASREYKQ